MLVTSVMIFQVSEVDAGVQVVTGSSLHDLSDWNMEQLIMDGVCMWVWVWVWVCVCVCARRSLTKKSNKIFIA